MARDCLACLLIGTLTAGIPVKAQRSPAKASKTKPSAPPKTEVNEPFLLTPIEVNATIYNDERKGWVATKRKTEPKILIPCESIPEVQGVPLEKITAVAAHFGLVPFNEKKLSPHDRLLLTTSFMRYDYAYKIVSDSELSKINKFITFYHSRRDGKLKGSLQQFILRVTAYPPEWIKGKARFGYFLQFIPIGDFEYANKNRGLFQNVLFDVLPLEEEFSEELRKEIGAIPGASFFASSQEWHGRTTDVSNLPSDD
jgi:hypothetical protein